MSKTNRQINDLRDLVQFGIHVHTMSVPKDFVVKVVLPKSIKQKIFSDLLDYGIDYGYVIESKQLRFELLGMKFEVDTKKDK